VFRQVGRDVPFVRRLITAILVVLIPTVMTAQPTDARRPKRSYTTRFQHDEDPISEGESPHRCTGYEVFWRCLKAPIAYAEIVRWNGKVGEWTSLKKHTSAKYGIRDGDLVEATIVGNVIKGCVNDVEVIYATDNTYKEGSPRMGFKSGRRCRLRQCVD
jgi:hypothetical protein